MATPDLATLLADACASGFTDLNEQQYRAALLQLNYDLANPPEPPIQQTTQLLSNPQTTVIYWADSSQSFTAGAATIVKGAFRNTDLATGATNNGYALLCFGANATNQDQMLVSIGSSSFNFNKPYSVQMMIRATSVAGLTSTTQFWFDLVLRATAGTNRISTGSSIAGNSVGFVFKGLRLFAAYRINATTFTLVDTGVDALSTNYTAIEIFGDGSGVTSWYVNGVEVYSLVGGPTGDSVFGGSAGVEALTGTPATSVSYRFGNLKAWQKPY